MKAKLSVAGGQWSVGGWRRAFTLMELMVAIAILVIIILAVGVVFSGTSRSVGMSQAVMEEMAGIRETQRLIEHDLQGLDRNGFLVIRCRLNNPNFNVVPGTSPPVTYADLSYRFDQISFLESGSFPNKSGWNDPQTPFSDSSIASAAHVWIGQGVLESASPPETISYIAPGQGALPGGAAGWQLRLPTGVTGTPMGTGPWENRVTLMVHRTLLFPGPPDGGNGIQPAGKRVMAYSGIDLGTPTINNGYDGPANITSSRWGVAAVTVPEIMKQIMGLRSGGMPTPEYDWFTYRFRALDSIYDTEMNVNPFVNGYFRTTPIMMRGVSSFRVDWTNGLTDGLGQLNWYGPTNPTGDATVEATPNYGDNYVAIFSYFNRARWPKALRISMHVANDRIGGRDFVQVVNLPQ